MEKINKLNSEILFFLPVSYHAARGKSYTRVINPHCEGNDTKTPRIRLSIKDDYIIPPEHYDVFYKKGTVQNKWRLLCIDYWYKLTAKRSEKELNKIDPRIVAWIKKDLDPKYFVPAPDTLPNANMIYL